MKKSAAAAAIEPSVGFVTPTLTALGEYVPELGGIYAGVVRADNGPDQVLVVSRAEAGEFEATKWKAAIKKFDALVIDDHKDWRLPTRRELRVLYANVAELFQKDWYWSSEQSESYADIAWCQNFSSGLQGYGRETNELRARAVRSVPVQSFSNSTLSPAKPTRRAKVPA